MDPISFIFDMNNSERRWTFHLFGDKKFSGKVISYTLNTEGMPTTISVKTDGLTYTGRVIEIPWVNIQFIVHAEKG